MNLADFHFLRPAWLLSLLPAIVLLVMLWRQRGRNRQWQPICDAHLLPHLWLDRPGKTNHIALLSLALGWLIAAIALAGPVWEKQPSPVYQKQAERIIVLDLSQSMNTADISPTRLMRARFLIEDILKQQTEGRNALLVFTGESHIVTPLTDDAATITAMLPALSSDIMPVAGDLAAPALTLAQTLLENTASRHGQVLLITDGFSDQAATLNAAKTLRSAGHQLHILGMGTATGTSAPTPDNNGFRGISPLNEKSLQAVSQTGGGTYRRFTPQINATDLTTPVSGHSLEAQLRDSAGVERWVEHSVWLLPALLLFSLAFRKGWLGSVLLCAYLVPPPASAWEWADLWLRPDQQAAKQLQQGDAESAAETFQNPGWKGVAEHKAGNYAAAAEIFQQWENGGAQADYNRGNALARSGELEAAIQAYQNALEIDPDHADAKANLELVESLLKQQQQNQQQQNDQNSQDENQQQAENDSSSSSQNQSENENSADKDTAQNTQNSDANEGDENAKNKNDEANEAEPSQQAQPQPEDKQEQPQDMSSGSNHPENHQNQDDAQQAQADVQPEQQEAPATANPTQPQPDEQWDEKSQAMQQWLGQIPDDPGGLLRRKFMLEHLRRQQQGQ